MSSKLPNRHSIQELLDLIDRKEKEENTVVNKSYDVFDFISHFNFQPGKYKVKMSLMYSFYKRWSKDPIPKSIFYRVFGPHFPISKRNSDLFYRINEKSLNLSKAAIKLYLDKKRNRSNVVARQIHFRSYINYYKLTSGNIWIEAFVLYYLYDKWSYKNNHKVPLGYKLFCKFCNIHFKSSIKTVHKTLWYSVGDEINQIISKKELDELRKAKRQRKEKKKSKKQDKISSSTTKSES